VYTNVWMPVARMAQVATEICEIAEITVDVGPYKCGKSLRMPNYPKICGDKVIQPSTYKVDSYERFKECVISNRENCIETCEQFVWSNLDISENFGICDRAMAEFQNIVGNQCRISQFGNNGIRAEFNPVVYQECPACKQTKSVKYIYAMASKNSLTVKCYHQERDNK
jgi:hypothetical protein